METDRQVGPRSAIAKRIESARVERARAPHEVVEVFLPCLHGVRFVEANRSYDSLPEALDVRFTEHGLRPTLVGVRDDRPVADPFRQVKARLGDSAHPRPTDPAAIEVGESGR